MERDNISAGQRPIKSGEKYTHYFPLPTNLDKIVKKNGEVMDTLYILKEVVLKSLYQTERISKFLQKESIYNSCKSIWTFLHDHIQYKLDAVGVEQLREPARSWSERNTGIDCDCFSVFVSSILSNLGISHKFRITKYDGKSQFQHIYVVIPNREKEIIIDCVLSKFDYEKPFSEKKDIIMQVSKGLNGIDIAVLSGVEEAPNFQQDYVNVLSGAHFDGSMDEDMAIIEHLQATRRIVSQRPDLVRAYDDPNALVQMLDYAITHWNTPNREKALSILAANEQVLNGILEDCSLGRSAKRQARKEARAEKKGARKEARVAKKEVRKETKAAKKEVKALQRTLKKVAATRSEKKAVKQQLKTAKKDIRSSGKSAIKAIRTTGKSNINAIRTAAKVAKKNPNLPVSKNIKRTPLPSKTILTKKLSPILANKKTLVNNVRNTAIANRTTLTNRITPIVEKQQALVASAQEKIKQNMIKMGAEPEEIDDMVLYEQEEYNDIDQDFEESEVNDVPEEEDYEFLNEEEEIDDEIEEDDDEFSEEEQGEYEDDETDDEFSEEAEEDSEEELGKLSKAERKQKRAAKKTARKQKKAEKKAVKKTVKAQNKSDRKVERARIKALPKKERSKARLKNVGKALVKYNPITASARGAFLIALKLNIGKMGSKAKWAYATEEQAKSKGISKQEWEIQKQNLVDMEKIFEKMGGTKSNLRVPILYGKAGNLAGVVLYTEEDIREDLEGLGFIGLGDPISVAAVAAGVAAAIPMIVEVVKAFKKNKSLTPEEEAAAMAEIQSSQGNLTQATTTAYENANRGFDFKKLIIPAVVVTGVGIWAASQSKKKKNLKKK